MKADGGLSSQIIRPKKSGLQPRVIFKQTPDTNSKSYLAGEMDTLQSQSNQNVL